MQMAFRTGSFACIINYLIQPKEIEAPAIRFDFLCLDLYIPLPSPYLGFPKNVATILNRTIKGGGVDQMYTDTDSQSTVRVATHIQ